MSFYDTILGNLPQIKGPTQKKLDLRVKFKWTLIVLVSYFILSEITLFGLSQNSLTQFQALSVLLGAEFGSLVSLGIGPIVTASIVLQLLNGSGIIKFDTTSTAGRSRFQGTSKLLAYCFVVFEAIIYVAVGGLAPDPALTGSVTYLVLQLLLMLQLIMGGFVIILLDDLVSKWGIGSGISLMIAAGVAKSLFIQTLSFFPNPQNPEYMVGAIPSAIQALARADIAIFRESIVAIIATIFIFLLVVFFQSMKVEIPLSFGRVRGYGIRWPLNFLYTSVIPVLLIAALLANIQIGLSLLESKMGWVAAGSLAGWFTAPSLVLDIARTGTLSLGWLEYVQAIVYVIILMIGALVFSFFWMQTSGMDAHSQAKQIMASGLQIPGFRKDPRIMEHVLNRYIIPLTVMGGLTIGFLAGFADVIGSLTQGTALLLAVMIVYKFYEDVAKSHMMDMNPMMRKFMGGK
ncbi:MAG: preprotein translocase subunit SecY [Candidatus Woesearchaeota archaeon]|jgi:preprotein translocase subunit SecY